MTRATDVLRLPVPRYCAMSAIERELLRRLRLVWMLWAGVDLELGELRRGELVLRQHALDGFANDLGRPAIELLAHRPRLQAAREARVPVDHLLVELLAGEVDLLRVDDDHEVTRVDVRRVLRLLLPAQGVGDLRREPAQGLPLGVDDVPVALDLSRLGGIGLHQSERRRSGDRTTAQCSKGLRTRTVPARSPAAGVMATEPAPDLSPTCRTPSGPCR